MERQPSRLNTSDKAHAKHFQHLQNDQKANLNIRFKLERTSLSKAKQFTMVGSLLNGQQQDHMDTKKLVNQ